MVVFRAFLKQKQSKTEIILGELVTCHDSGPFLLLLLSLLADNPLCLDLSLAYVEESELIAMLSFLALGHRWPWEVPAQDREK